MSIKRICFLISIMLLVSCGSEPIADQHFVGKWNVFEELNGMEYQAGTIEFDETSFHLTPLKDAQCAELLDGYQRYETKDGNKVRFFSATDQSKEELECYVGVENENITHLHYNQYSLKLTR